MKHVHNDSEVVCVTPDLSIREAAATMKERGIGSLVVIDGDGNVSGIVTDRDLCLRAVRWDRDPDETPVSKAMTTDVRTLSADSTRDDQIGLMRRMGVRRVPLVDGTGKPVGLISVDDWLRWTATRLHEVASTSDPALRHGPLRAPGDLLDDLERHLERQMEAREEDPLQTRTVVDRDALLDAIAKLRAGMTGTT
ncbi:MAG: CBS domain-containing protein [Planctomycetota bacterium]